MECWVTCVQMHEVDACKLLYIYGGYNHGIVCVCVCACALPFTGTTICQKGDFSEWQIGAVVFGQKHGCSFQEVAKFFGLFKSTANSVHILWKQYESSIMTNWDHRHLWHFNNCCNSTVLGALN